MQRLVVLDGLRGVLAVYVMLGHAAYYADLPAWLSGDVAHGHAAVDLFFALSGLVILLSLERHDFRPRPFLAARARRILPVYWIALALAGAVIALGSPTPAMPWVTGVARWFWSPGVPGPVWAQFAAHALLIHGLLPNAILPYAWVVILGPAWSLSTEAQFYAVLAALGRQRPATICALLIASACLYRALVPSIPPAWSLSRAFLPEAAPYFALGIATLGYLRSGKPGVLLATALAAGLLASLDGPAELLPILAWLLIAAAVRGESGTAPLARALATPPLRWLGAISYPLYLINEPVQRGLALALAPLAQGDAERFTRLWLAPALIAPVLVAALLHKGVEERAAFLKKSGAKNFCPAGTGD